MSDQWTEEMLRGLLSRIEALEQWKKDEARYAMIRAGVYVPVPDDPPPLYDPRLVRGEHCSVDCPGHEPE
jgi:hypothetical protein